MGAGASMDQEQNMAAQRSEDGAMRYYCHECRRTFLSHHQDRDAPLQCAFCQSSFLEEMDSSTQESRRLHHNLNEEQTRRLTSAAALLQMLETQLRDELELLQTTLVMQSAQAKRPAFTQGMRDSLKNVKTSVNMICEQPSCPICSEDYGEHEDVTKLPCDHIYHKDCVMPWLEGKRTCPICRFELKHVVTACAELEQLSREELKHRLSSRVEDEELQGMQEESKAELAVRLHCFLAEEQEELDEQQREDHHHQHQPAFRFRQRRPLLASQDPRPGPVASLPHRHMRWDALFQRPQDAQLPARGVGGGEGGDNIRRRMLDSDDYDDDEEAEDEDGPGFYGGAGHMGALHLPRLGPGPRRLVIASSVGDQGEVRATADSRSGSGAGSGLVPGGGTSALGSAQHNSVVYRSHSQPLPLHSGGGSPVATLLTEATGSRTAGAGTGSGGGSGSASNSSFRFSTMSHSPPSLSSSAHVSSQRLVSSGHSSLGGGVTGGMDMDDIDEVVDSAAARAAFLASSAAAGAVAGRQLSLPTSTTFMIRSSGNGSASTVVPVVNPPPQP